MSFSHLCMDILLWVVAVDWVTTFLTGFTRTRHISRTARERRPWSVR